MNSSQLLQELHSLGKVSIDLGQTACKTPDAYEYIEKTWVRKKK